jgi:hypothetical protein
MMHSCCYAEVTRRTVKKGERNSRYKKRMLKIVAFACFLFVCPKKLNHNFWLIVGSFKTGRNKEMNVRNGIVQSCLVVFSSACTFVVVSLECCFVF